MFQDALVVDRLNVRFGPKADVRKATHSCRRVNIRWLAVQASCLSSSASL